ncbi:unnamed protein product [Cylicocyclus nassatus]|uniref:Uncharacterized protein n=1 Tax=Cylicocyclus nassatus TaxID=53992 RepID=A0AA36HDF9_CYLNA|nr:unnamed protein product [Cylicocyclus nassatus]
MQTACVYLFAIFCATVTAQYDDLSILEEVLDRTTIPAVEVEPEFTIEFGTAPSSTASSTVPEVTTTTTEKAKHTTKTTKMEKEIEEISPLVSTPVVEPSPSSTTDKTEIPLVEKEPNFGLKPDLSRIYRRLFPYRNI